MYIDTLKGRTISILPTDISLNNLYITSSHELTSDGILNITLLNDEDIKIHITSKKLSDYYYEVVLKESFPDSLKTKISELLTLQNQKEKRIEKRYEIGLENWKSFGLYTPEISIIYNSSHYKAIISNISFHGALIITENPNLQINDNITINMTFTTNLQQIIQNAYVLNKSLMENGFLRCNLRFKDPVNINLTKYINDYSLKIIQ